MNVENSPEDKAQEDTSVSQSVAATAKTQEPEQVADADASGEALEMVQTEGKRCENVKV